MLCGTDIIFVEYSLHSISMWRIFGIILSVPQNIVMDPNNVMQMKLVYDLLILALWCLEWLVFVVFVAMMFNLDFIVKTFTGSPNVIREFSNNLWSLLLSSHVSAMIFQRQKCRSHQSTVVILTIEPRMIYKSWAHRVEAPIANYLRDSPLDLEEYKAVQIFLM